MYNLKRGQVSRGGKVHLFRTHDGSVSRFPVCGSGKDSTGQRRSGRYRPVSSDSEVTCANCAKILADNVREYWHNKNRGGDRILPDVVTQDQVENVMVFYGHNRIIVTRDQVNELLNGSVLVWADGEYSSSMEMEK